jgi:hypothetical protein
MALYNLFLRILLSMFSIASAVLLAPLAAFVTAWLLEALFGKELVLTITVLLFYPYVVLIYLSLESIMRRIRKICYP